MTVHMIKIWSEYPNNDNHFNRMYQACEDWASNYAETLETQRLALTRFTADETTNHTAGWWRFEWHEDATPLLDDLESDLQSEVEYYRIRYHSCDHDEASGDGCSWDESQTREYGTVPEGIP